MKLTAKEIAEIVEGELFAQPEIVITGAASLSEAGKDDVSFLGNEKYSKQVASSRAGLILLPKKYDVSDKPAVKVKNPQLAFAKILEIIEKERIKLGRVGVHPSCVVSRSAKIGLAAHIGPYSVIEDNAVIGDRTIIYAQCYVGENTKIGEECLIYPGVIIRENVVIGNKVILNPGVIIGGDGFGFVPDGNSLHKIPQIGTVDIGDNVEIGANTTVDRATIGKTFIGRGTKIDNQIQIAHNVQIGENCIIVSSASIAGSARIGNNVTIAGQAGVAGHISIGDGAIIGGQSGVISDIKSGEIVSGLPARDHKKNLKIQALIQKLPEIYEKIKKMEKKG
ncbi:MAG: UDP-3-O-(3-hydroxymyristoyl)glucosamine N-acyltransferase [Elusimicrobia bacterium]|nr:UDP-3-O-(3-hydroxymyristoyl)glucosamine N-acyltransferase [Candidatus Liberimonas magnetica]